MDNSVNGKPVKLRVILADDHNLFREGLRHLLQDSGHIEVVGEACNGEDAVRLVREHQPEIVLMDVNMPGVDGIRATEVIAKSCPRTAVIILTMQWDDDCAIQAVRAGARGFILKSTTSAEVIRAIGVAASGGSAIDPTLAPVLLREYHRMLTNAPEESSRDGALTQRESVLLKLLAAGYNNRQIAKELELAESTVKNNLSALFQKIGVRDRTQAVLYAFSEGIVTRPMARAS